MEFDEDDIGTSSNLEKAGDEEEEKFKKENIKKLSNKEIFFKSAKISLKNWKKSIYRQIYVFLSQMFSVYLPILKANIIDTISTKGATYDDVFKAFKKYLTFFIADTFYKQLFDIFEYIFVSSSTNKYKCILIEKIMEKDIVFFDIFKTGELLNKIEYCDDHIQNDFIFKTFSLIQSISKLILMVYYLYKASPNLMIVFATIFFIQIGTDYILDNNTSFNETFDKGMESKNKYLNKLTEIISNIRMVKSFAKEKDEVKKIEEYKRLMSYDLDIISTFMFQMTMIVGDLGEVVTLLYAGKYILQNKFTLGQFTIFKQYQLEFKISYESIKNMIKNYRQLIKDWKIFFEIYDFPVKIFSLKNYIPKNILGEIKFDKVKFAYPLKPKSFIFDNLSFKIPAGKTFAICGFSGSGKTTISNLIQRFYDPNEGKILIDGVDLRDYNIEYLRKNIGFVAQEPVLNSGTIEENITYGVDTYKKSDFQEVCKLSNINSFVNDKNLFPEGLKTLVGERGTKVSGGQKQRIAIARALMKNSKILIFDEATSALDAESEAQVQGAIDNVVKKRGITIIIIAHRLSTIIKADCIAVINNGKVVEMGKHEELLKKNGEYKKLFQKQLVLDSVKENKEKKIK